MISVQINGEQRQVAPHSTLSDLLRELKLTTDRVAIELNETVVPRAKHATTTIAPNDRIEIVTFVGGG